MNAWARAHGAGIACCLAALLATAVTGCTGASTSSKSGATASAQSPSTASAASPAASSPSPAARKALDAKTLNSVLLPASDMPKGFTVYPQGTRYDGVALPEDTPSPVPGSQLCAILAQTAWIRAAGINTQDFAQSDYLNSGRTEEVAEEVDAFQGTDAQQAMTALWNAFGRCKSFTQSANGPTTTTYLSRSRIGGQQDGIKAVELSPEYQGGETLVAIRVGYAIVTVLDSSTGSDNGSAALTMAERIATRLAAAENGA